MHDDYMTTQEVADFIGVHRRMVEKWRNKGWLMPDVIGHGKNGRGGVYYYSKERILQLASVYRKKNCDQTATTCATSRTATEEETTTATQQKTATKLRPLVRLRELRPKRKRLLRLNRKLRPNCDHLCDFENCDRRGNDYCDSTENCD